MITYVFTPKDRSLRVAKGLCVGGETVAEGRAKPGQVRNGREITAGRGRRFQRRDRRGGCSSYSQAVSAQFPALWLRIRAGHKCRLLAFLTEFSVRLGGEKSRVLGSFCGSSALSKRMFAVKGFSKHFSSSAISFLCHSRLTDMFLH